MPASLTGSRRQGGQPRLRTCLLVTAVASNRQGGGKEEGRGLIYGAARAVEGRLHKIKIKVIEIQRGH